MTPKEFLKKKFIITLIGFLGFVVSLWYLIVCVLMTMHSSFSETQNIPLFSFFTHLPNIIFQHTNIPIINWAWEHATIVPFMSKEFTREHLIILGIAATCGLFGGMIGDYPRAKGKINKFKREAFDEQLRKGIKGHSDFPSTPSIQNELRILIETEQSWHQSWWGVILITILCGVVLALILNPFGLN